MSVTGPGSHDLLTGANMHDSSSRLLNNHIFKKTNWDTWCCL